MFVKPCVPCTNFGTLKIYKSRETKEAILRVINGDEDVAKAYADVCDRIAAASDDVPITLWGRGKHLSLSSVKYKKRSGNGGLPKTDEIKPKMSSQEKIGILDKWACDLETFMGKGDCPVSKIMGGIYDRYC